MRIAGIYSFNDGEKVVNAKYADLRKEVERAIRKIDASACKTKESEEKTMTGDMLYSPVALNEVFKAQLGPLDWKSVRVKCEYPTEFYVKGYAPKKLRKGALREMDFVKRKLGVEVQFGKYSFMVYNVAAKMTMADGASIDGYCRIGSNGKASTAAEVKPAAAQKAEPVRTR